MAPADRPGPTAGPRVPDRWPSSARWGGRRPGLRTRGVFRIWHRLCSSGNVSTVKHRQDARHSSPVLRTGGCGGHRCPGWHLGLDGQESAVARVPATEPPAIRSGRRRPDPLVWPVADERVALAMNTITPGTGARVRLRPSCPGDCRRPHHPAEDTCHVEVASIDNTDHAGHSDVLKEYVEIEAVLGAKSREGIGSQAEFCHGYLGQQPDCHASTRHMIRFAPRHVVAQSGRRTRPRSRQPAARSRPP